jgi:hypothetical protein
MPYKPSPQTLARAAIAKSKMSAKIRARSGKTAPLSVKKASTEVKPTVRANQLAAKSATAYGATKGLAVGGEHGGAGIAQKSGEVKIYTPAEIEAINKERGTMPVELSPEEKRKNMIKAAVERAAAKLARSFDVPTMKPQTAEVQDLIDAHRSRHYTMDEEVELEEGKYASTIAAIAAQAYKPKVGDKVRTRKGGQIPGTVEKIEGNKVFFRHPEGKLYATHSSNLMREEAESVNEDQAADWQKVQSMEKGSMIGGKDAMKMHLKYLNAVHAHQKKHGLDTAKTKKKIEDINRTLVQLGEEVELEEGKIAKALAVGAMSLASMGAKAHTDTTKSVAQLAAERPALAQRLKDIGATGQVPASDKRAAELQRKQDQEMPASERRAKELKKEEVEQVVERNLENKKKKNNWVRGLGVKAAIRGDVPFDRGHSPLRSGREVLAREDIMNEQPKDAADAGEYDYEGDMAKSQLRSIMANSKRLHDMLEENTNLPEWVQSKITLAQDYIQTAASYMEAEMNEEVVTEAKGTVAVTPQEIDLAAHHGDPNRITYGDVIKARILNRRKKNG